MSLCLAHGRTRDERREWEARDEHYLCCYTQTHTRYHHRPVMYLHTLACTTPLIHRKTAHVSEISALQIGQHESVCRHSLQQHACPNWHRVRQLVTSSPRHTTHSFPPLLLRSLPPSAQHQPLPPPINCSIARSNSNESCHISISHVAYEYVMSHMTVLPITYEWDTSHVNESVEDTWVSYSQVGYFSNQRRFSVKSGSQSIPSSLPLWKWTNYSVVIQVWSLRGKHAASARGWLW